MRRLLVMAVIIGAGGFAAASQAGMSVRMTDPHGVDTKSERITMRAGAQTCRIDKTLKYDFAGNPYMKKVRICA